MTQSPRETPRAYRRTLFDRHGPDAARMIDLGLKSPIIFLLSLILCSVIVPRFQLPLPLSTAFVLLGSVALTAAMLFAIAKTSDAAGASMRVVVEGGLGIAYEDQFSREQSLVMKGQVSEALESFEQRIREPDSGIDVRIRAAELYAGLGQNPTRAAELLRAARALPGLTPRQEVYIVNRLVDLLMGPLGDPGRALVELRRLVERYPTSSAASHARVAIANIKSRAAQS